MRIKIAKIPPDEASDPLYKGGKSYRSPRSYSQPSLQTICVVDSALLQCQILCTVYTLYNSLKLRNNHGH